VLVQSIKITYNNTQYSSESRKLQFYCMLYLLQVQNHLSSTMFLLTIFLKCLCSIICHYITHYLMFMVTSVSSVFGKRLLVGVELFNGFHSVKRDPKLSCVKAGGLSSSM